MSGSEASRIGHLAKYPPTKNTHPKKPRDQNEKWSGLIFSQRCFAKYAKPSAHIFGCVLGRVPMARPSRIGGEACRQSRRSHQKLCVCV